MLLNSQEQKFIFAIKMAIYSNFPKQEIEKEDEMIAEAIVKIAQKNNMPAPVIDWQGSALLFANLLGFTVTIQDLFSPECFYDAICRQPSLTGFVKNVIDKRILQPQIDLASSFIEAVKQLPPDGSISQRITSSKDIEAVYKTLCSLGFVKAEDIDEYDSWWKNTVIERVRECYPEVTDKEELEELEEKALKWYNEEEPLQKFSHILMIALLRFYDLPASVIDELWTAVYDGGFTEEAYTLFAKALETVWESFLNEIESLQLDFEE